MLIKPNTYSMSQATTQALQMTTPTDQEIMAFSRCDSLYHNIMIDNRRCVQINDNYWCDANVGYGADCNVACSNLLDSSISDDCSCAKIIYQRHGFDAWYASLI